MVKNISMDTCIRTRKSAIFEWILIVFWCKDTTLSYILQIYKRIPIVGFTYQYVMPIAFIALAFVALLTCKIRRLSISSVVLFTVVIILSMLSALVHSDIIMSELPRFLLTALPLIAVGFNLDENRIIAGKYPLTQVIYIASLINIIGFILYVLYFLDSRTIDNSEMTWSYSILPSMLYISFFAIRKRKTLAIILSVAGGALLLFLGTRGTIVCLLVFIAVQFLYLLKKKGSRIVAILIIASLIMFIQFGDYLAIVRAMREYANSLGLSTRIFDTFLNKEFFASSGRDALKDVAIEAIKRRPLFGYGLFGDRYLANAGSYEVGNYAHNIVIELWVQFGVILGSLLFLSVVMIIIKTIFRVTDNMSGQLYLWVFICAGFVKLFLSGSYLLEPYFFLLVGFCVKTIKQRNGCNIIKKRYDNKSKYGIVEYKSCRN